MHADRLAADQRGSASTEGVIVALFLAIVFGASIWVTRLFVASLAMGREVRAAIDGPSFTGGRGGADDHARTSYFAPARARADRWVPLRSIELGTIEIERVRAARSREVERPDVLGGGGEALRWNDSRVRNEVPRAGPDGNWPAMRDTWCRTGMCDL